MSKYRYALLDLKWREMEANSISCDNGQLEFYDRGQMVAVFAKGQWVSCELVTDRQPATEPEKDSKAKK